MFRLVSDLSRSIGEIFSMYKIVDIADFSPEDFSKGNLY
jgi:hypothetical protein